MNLLTTRFVGSQGMANAVLQHCRQLMHLKGGGLIRQSLAYILCDVHDTYPC